MKILAIDPGPEQSAWVVWDGRKVLDCGIVPNLVMLAFFDARLEFLEATHCVIEKIACYGMAVGAEVFETCVWTGRFMQAWCKDNTLTRIPRGEIKLHLCRSNRAKDANIAQALRDRFGKPGTKKNPGPLFGISSHKWAALAVAVTAHDRAKVGL